MTKSQAMSTVVPPSLIHTAAAPTIGLPVRLAIPLIGVSAAVEYTGLTADGAMDIKQDPVDVAWYEYGPRPGQAGSAVIAGHYGWDAHGQGSVFNNLHTLQVGDTLSVYDSAGKRTTFVVTSTKLYDPSADAAAVFTSHDGKAHLNLITCNGTWEASQQTYSNRLVIFTDKVTT